MKKVAIKRTLTLALVTMLVVSVSSQAQEMRQQRGSEEMRQQHKKEMRGPRIPDLSSEQKEQMKDLKTQHSKEVLPIHNTLKEKEARLNTLTTAEKFNSSEVGRVIESIGDLKTELMKLRVAHMQDLKEILNDEQVAILNNQMAKRPGQHSARQR